MTDKQELRTPGEVLAAARKQRFLTVAQVAEQTKIPVAMVEAVEADEYHLISGPLYVRSFLRTIAQAVGADPEQVLQLYAGMAGREGGADADEAPVWQADEVIVQRLGNGWRPWMTYALVAVAAVLILGAGVRGCLNRQDNSGTEPGAHATLPETSTTVADSQLVTDGTTAAAAEATAPEVPCPGAGAPVDFKDAEARTAADDLILAIECAHVVSLSVRTDGEREFTGADWSAGPQGIPAFPDGQIVPGRVYRCGGRFIVFWHASDHFGLKVGDPEGVAVRLQGRPYPLDGLTAGQEIILDRHSLGS